MEVLVLIDFEGTMGDEMTVQVGDVVKSVTKASEEGWLEGELRGKRGIFPANFVKEVPVYLIGDSKREPRSLRKSRMIQHTRKCEVAFAYSPLNEDELELVVGETIEILREIEDGWWMGMKSGKVGALPSNFTKEIFVSRKDVKHNESKTRPKLSDTMFSKETKLPQRTSVRNKTKNVKECCQVMFDYAALTEDELNLKKGDIVTIITKETEDDGWWEGELNGRRGFFPDNFVMVIPMTNTLQSGSTSQLPERRGTDRHAVKAEGSAMEMSSPAKAKDEKPESKDLRSNPPTKVKLPAPSRPVLPPPVKDKPHKFGCGKANGDLPPLSPKCTEESNSDQFDGVEVSPEKLSHPTANRAKPPQRRPPSALVTGPQALSGRDQTEAEKSPKLLKVAEPATSPPSKPEHPTKNLIPSRLALPKAVVEAREAQEEKPCLDSLHAEVRELKMALELLQNRHERDIQELKEELRDERNKRGELQEEVRGLRTKHSS
ncbi:SH3 domain-containing kinase-binding protein 1-like isoform X2 [Coregonus clupeaformis]|uniref:SH3 domain-containing kinase-binding protein 1-like isoform X2 n=1 Tax=Coregonus clupeaformis TaxID=59861 RepID=UPI001BE05C88|nr:SH3 domain-containing kinase-binding protein 1-like isoform X2 [Coregonus clupeaformis]